MFLQLVARVEAQLRQRDGWIMAEMEAARESLTRLEHALDRGDTPARVRS